MPVVDTQTWNEFLRGYPDAHLLQTSGWGALKSGFGWKAIQVVSENSGAQILFRKLPLGLSLAYIPKGPVGKSWDQLWPELDIICKSHRAVFLKVEFDLWQEEMTETVTKTIPPSYRPSPHEIQSPRSILVDLRGSEDQILSHMKQKTCYNIRLAQRKGIVIRQSEDIETFHQLMQVTGERDSFAVHSLPYYQQAFDLFAPRGQSALFIAEFEEQPLAGLMVFARGSRAWYFYGASSNEQRHLMPTYLLQWRAMQWAKAQGCLVYDLWGIPDEDDENPLVADEVEESSNWLWIIIILAIAGIGGFILLGKKKKPEEEAVESEEDEPEDEELSEDLDESFEE